MPRWPDCVPTLTDGVVTLRAHSDEDVPLIVELGRDPASQRALPLPDPYTEADAREFIDSVRDTWESGAAHEWAITGSDGRYAGSANLHHRTAQRAEIGYAAHPAARGQGLMSRAIRLLVQRAFEEGVELVRWRSRAGNLASARVAWSCGFGAPTVVVGGRVGTDGDVDDEWHAAIRAGDPLRPTRPWWTPAVLDSERIRLRPWRADDRPTDGPDPIAELGNPGMQPTPETFAEWLAARELRMAQGEGVFWCIADRDSDRPLGHVQLARLAPTAHPGTGLLGYWLVPQARGRGYLAEALALLIPHAFRARGEDLTGRSGLGLHRLEALADLANVASQRVLRRAGFREIGLRREATAATPGSPARDEPIFELLASDDVAAQAISPFVTPVFETPQVRLRPWRDTDAPQDGDIVDPDAARWVPERGIPTPETFTAWVARRRRFADQRQALNWCLADRATDRAMGNVTLFVHGDEPIDFQAELGYFLWPWARGRRILGEVVPVVLAHAFAPVGEGGLGLTRVQAGTDSDNLASQAVLRRAGFRQWGEDRQAFRARDGQLTDGTYFELLATDHAAGQANRTG